MRKQEIFNLLGDTKTASNWRVQFISREGKKIDETTKAELNQNGGIQRKLKDIYNQGYDYVQMKVHKRDGVAKWRLISCNNFKLGSSSLEETEQQPQKVIKKEKIQPVVSEPEIITPPAPSINVGGLNGGVGLGQYMEAYAGSRMHQITQEQLRELQAKYETVKTEKERLKDENFDLKRRIDRLEDAAERKSILDSIDVNAVLPALVGLLKPNPAIAGLSQPARPELTGYKEAVRTEIENPTMPDAIAQRLYAVLQQYMSNNQEFVNEFETLLKNNSVRKAE